MTGLVFIGWRVGVRLFAELSSPVNFSPLFIRYLLSLRPFPVKCGKFSSKLALRIYSDSVNQGVVICSKIC